MTNPDGQDGSNSSSCAIAGSSTTKAGLAGLLLYALIPGAIVLRRRFRIKNDR